MKLIIVLYKPVYSLESVNRLCECFDTELYIIDANEQESNNLGNFQDFLEKFAHHRKIFITPHTNQLINDFTFQENDVLLFGSENGLSLEYARYCDCMLAIKMPSNCMALSVYVCVAITLQFTV